jgi:intracellular multiplication protein IcmO
MPEDLISPLQAYLGELPGYDMSLDWSQLKTKEALRQHNFAQFCFTQTFPVLDPGTSALH